MKSGGEVRRSARARLLSREELALWRHATADVRPRDTMALLAEPSETAAPLEPAREAAPVPERLAPADVQAEQRSEKSSQASLAPLAPIERRLKRKLSSGKVQVDDVIDLHGLTQAQAHRALTNFIWRAAENGQKLVLVITGKGLASGGEDGGLTERGVLRRNVPHWLRAAELRPLVLSIEEAARPHGGGGALYVRLRRRIRG